MKSIYEEIEQGAKWRNDTQFKNKCVRLHINAKIANHEQHLPPMLLVVFHAQHLIYAACV